MLVIPGNLRIFIVISSELLRFPHMQPACSGSWFSSSSKLDHIPKADTVSKLETGPTLNLMGFLSGYMSD